MLVAAPAQAKPDTDCMRAGIATLKAVGLFTSAVAKSGITVGTAVSVGVTARNGLPEGFTLDTVIPYSDPPGRPPGRREQHLRLPLVQLTPSFGRTSRR